MALLFSYPSFHFSTIPIFHSASIGKQNPFGVKSKPGPLGQDSLLFGFIFPFGMFDTPAGNNGFTVDHMKFFVQNFETV